MHSGNMERMFANCIKLLLLLVMSIRADDFKTRIVGGRMSNDGAWPFMAAVLVGNRQHCGGTVWNKDFIITAAHCWNPNHRISRYSVYLGHADITSYDSAYRFYAAEFIAHPKYSERTYKHDIGLIRLRRSIEFGDKHWRAGCVCDPEPAELLQADKCMALGWGLTRALDKESKSTQLLEVNLPLLTPDKCAEWNENGKYNRHWLVCAGWENGTKDTCNADSGGPLVCPLKKDDKKWSLIGITSFGSRDCGSTHRPGYYTRVDMYLHWIQEVTNSIKYHE